MSGVVQYEVRDGVAWLTINRPEARNALSLAVRDGLWAGYRRFNEDEEAGVLILTGTGDKAFCAGGDLKEMASLGLAVPPRDFVPMPGHNIEVVKPTIAAVNGAALAGGFALAQYCDLCIAADTASFAISEVRVGRGAPWASPLPWLIPPRVAMELLLTGEPISAERAMEVGLVNRVVLLADLAETAQSMAQTILANAPLSVAAGKRTVYLALEEGAGSRSDRADALSNRADALWAPVYESHDAKEGPAAFREGRKPRWLGR